jgi:hypothetical protein
MATLQDLMGGGIPAGLLDPQQEQALQERAKSQGLLNLGFALLQASQGQPGQGKPRLGQIIGQAGPTFAQGYRGAFDETLQNIVRSQQVQDMQKKREQQLKSEASRQQVAQQFAPMTPQTALAAPGPTAARAGMIGQTQPFDRDKLLGFLADPNLPAADKNTILEMYKVTAPKEAKPVQYSEMFKNAAITLYGTDAGPFTAEQRKAIEAKANEYRIEPQVAAAKATASANLRDPLRLQTSAIEIARNFSKDLDPDYQVADRFKVIQDSIANPTPIGDTAIIYSLAKIINPGEAIMEGDIRNILSNRSIPDAVKQAAQKAVSGENLTQNERLEIQSVAWKILQERKSRVDRKTGNTAKQLEKLGQTPSEYISNPYDTVTAPDQLVVTYKGKKTIANKAQDGDYYIQVGNKFFKVNR